MSEAIKNETTEMAVASGYSAIATCPLFGVVR